MNDKFLKLSTHPYGRNLGCIKQGIHAFLNSVAYSYQIKYSNYIFKEHIFFLNQYLLLNKKIKR